jgi:hypothetical protein
VLVHTLKGGRRNPLHSLEDPREVEGVVEARALRNLRYQAIGAEQQIDRQIHAQLEQQLVGAAIGKAVEEPVQRHGRHTQLVRCVLGSRETGEGLFEKRLGLQE